MRHCDDASRARATLRWSLLRCVAAVLAATALACASTQTVELACVPEQATIYVDGRLLEEHPDELVLTSDEPHKIYVKAPGRRPQLVVLDSVPTRDGGTELTSDRVCVEPVAAGLDRELVLEVDEVDPVGAGGPASDSPGDSPSGSR